MQDSPGDSAQEPKYVLTNTDEKTGGKTLRALQDGNSPPRLVQEPTPISQLAELVGKYSVRKAGQMTDLTALEIVGGIE
jgi:hypothetical protein